MTRRFKRSKEWWLARIDGERDGPIGAGVPPCQHENFEAEVDVHRLEPTAATGATKMRFMADVRVQCAQCKRRFQFVGLPAGADLGGATVSIDALEARLAICPQGEQPSTLDRIAVHFPPTVLP